MCHTYENGDTGQGFDKRRLRELMSPPAGIGASGAGPPVLTAGGLQGLVLLQQVGQHLYGGGREGAPDKCVWAGEVASICIRASSV